MYSDEKNALLKYFYLIDTERLTEKVKNSLSKSNSTEPDTIFQIMFSEISTVCNKYIGFIDSTNSFNRPAKSGTPFVPSYPLEEILKNYCILHGFHSALKEECDSTIKISGKNDSLLRHGYFATGHSKDKPGSVSGSNGNNKDEPAPISDNGNTPDKTIYQQYNGYKQRFLNHPASYSYCILKKHIVYSHNDFPHVQSYDGNWGCFIFTNHYVLTLDKNISNHNSAIITNYGKLLRDSIQWCKINELLPEDRFLFESAMEQIYGFRFFSYAAKLLNRVYTDSLSFGNSDITYKDLEGSTLLNVIRQAARLPVTYNRSAFLEYAIDSVIRSRYLKDLEYQEKPTSLFSHTSKKPASPLLLLTSGFEHIRKYLQKLNHIALPLLGNVWDSLTDRLNKGDSRFPINTDTYRAYIRKNFSAIQQDCSHYFQPKEAASHAGFPEDTDSFWQDFSFKGTLSAKYERDSFTSLLFDYLNTDRLIPHTDPYHMLTPYPDIIAETEKYTVEHNFYKYHAENILSFVENVHLSTESNASHSTDKE